MIGLGCNATEGEAHLFPENSDVKLKLTVQRGRLGYTYKVNHHLSLNSPFLLQRLRKWAVLSVQWNFLPL